MGLPERAGQGCCPLSPASSPPPSLHAALIPIPSRRAPLLLPTHHLPSLPQAAAVRAYLLAQATHLLTAVDEASAASVAFPHPQPLPLPRRPPPAAAGDLPIDEAHAAVAEEDEAEAEAAARVRAVLGWSLVKRRSTVGAGGGGGESGSGRGGWDGGMGVVAAGRVPAGTMVAWYPGVAYGPGDVSGTSVWRRWGGGRGGGEGWVALPEGCGGGAPGSGEGA